MSTKHNYHRIFAAYFLFQKSLSTREEKRLSGLLLFSKSFLSIFTALGGFTGNFALRLRVSAPPSRINAYSISGVIWLPWWAMMSHLPSRFIQTWVERNWMLRTPWTVERWVMMARSPWMVIL